jgi:hypothetical protein
MLEEPVSSLDCILAMAMLFPLLIGRLETDFHMCASIQSYVFSYAPSALSFTSVLRDAITEAFTP